MSTISASTTSTTAYKVTADTTGTLVLQTGSTPTTAVTIGTDQSVTTAGTINSLTVGRGAGSVATNTAVGASALAANTTGASNSAFGDSALAANTTGSNNQAFGRGALSLNIDGGQNIAVGRLALGANTNGPSNTAVGHTTLTANTTGGYNTAVGQSALGANTTASNNTAVGYQAGYSNTVGIGNVHIGYQAGYTNGAGNNYNTFIGHQAGYYAARVSGNAVNTAVGYSAGISLTNGYYNTFIGPASGNAITTGNNNTIIGGFSGNQNGLDIRTASNYIVLSDGDGNPRGYFNNSGTFVVGGASWIAGGVLPSSTGVDNSRIFNSTSGTTGTVTLYIGNASITTSSDVRLKENIVDTQRNATEILSQLRVVDHTWNDPSDTSVNNRNSRGVWMGLIAQEAQPIIPWLVNKPLADEDEEGNPQYWHMDYGYAVPLLIKAIQELKAEIDTLKGQA